MITAPEIDSLKITDSQMERCAVMIAPEIKDDVQALLWKFNVNLKKTKLEILESNSAADLSTAARQRQKRVKKNRARSLNRWKRKIRSQTDNPTVEDTKETVKEARKRISTTMTSAFKLARATAPPGQKQLAAVGKLLVGLFRGQYRKLSKKLLDRYINEP
jgi:hypothetical protein